MSTTLNSEKLIEIFNTQLNEFLHQVRNAFPSIQNDKAVLTMSNTLETTLVVSPSVPIHIFYNKFVKLYDKEITNRDEQFFAKLLLQKKNSKANPVELFIYIQKHASHNNKKIIWEYIERLRLLAIKYHDYEKKMRQQKAA